MKKCQKCKNYENTGTIIRIYSNNGICEEMCDICAWNKYFNIQNRSRIIINSTQQEQCEFCYTNEKSVFNQKELQNNIR